MESFERPAQNSVSQRTIVLLRYLQKPERDEWGTGLEAMQAALALEKSVNQSLLDLHAIADKHNDYQVGANPAVVVTLGEGGLGCMENDSSPENMHYIWLKRALQQT